MTASTLFAQNTGVIRGVVKDGSGEIMPGAFVLVTGTTNGAATDINGAYILQGVKPGKVTVKASYLGYKDVDSVVEIAAGKTTILDIVMASLDNSLDAVTVTAAIDGQQRALNQQKLASNQMQILSADQIGLFPDLNVTDALKRVGGITTDGNQISMRGTPNNFTNINLDGEQLMGTAEGGQRAPNLEVIPSDVLSSLEIQKTLLPSNDGDAIAGVINLRSGEARSLKPRIKVEAGPGYNVLRGKANVNGKFSYEQRFHATDKNPYGVFGVVAKLSYYDSWSGYDRLDANNWVESSVNGLEDKIYVPKDFRYRYVTNNMQRYGASAVLDWSPSVNTKFVLIGTYNRQNTTTERDRNRFRFRGAYYDPKSYDFSSDVFVDGISSMGFGEHALATDRAQNIRQYTDINEDIYNYQINLSGESTIGDWKLDGGVVYSFSETAYTSTAYNFQTPDYRANKKDINGSGNPAMQFAKNTPVAFIPDITSPSLSMDYLVRASGAMEGRALDQAENYTLYNVEEWDHTTHASTTTAKFNASWNHNIGEGSAVLSFGVKDKFITNSGFVPEGGSDVYAYSLPKKAFGDPALNMTNFMKGQMLTDKFLNNTLNIKYDLNKDKIRDFRAAGYNGLLKLDDVLANRTMDSYYFDAKENILAGYLMEKVQFSKLMALAGVRIEANTVKYEANSIFQYDSSVDLDQNPSGQNPDNLGPDGDGPVYDAYTKNLLQKSQSYIMVLPNVQFKYDLNRSTVFRLAYTTGYSRPDAVDLVPKTTPNTDIGIVTMGNPDLKPAYSHNFDFIAEKYLGNVGLISAGLFYKNIDKFVYLSQTALPSDNPYSYDNSPFTSLRQKQNGEAANVYGVELTLNSALTFLPGFLKNLVFTSNFTYIHSKATLERMDEESAGESYKDAIRLPGQADFTANLSLAYSDKLFTLQASANYIGDFIYSLGANSEMDVWMKGRWQTDLNGSINIMKGLSFYVQANNLFNSPKFMYMGNTDRVYELRYMGATARCGIRYVF